MKNPPNTVIDTIADSVKSSLGPTTYPLVRDLVDDVFTATEEEIEDATKFTMERAKQVGPIELLALLTTYHLAIWYFIRIIMTLHAHFPYSILHLSLLLILAHYS